MIIRLMPARKRFEDEGKSNANHRHQIDIGGWNDYIITSNSISIAHATAPVLTLYRNGLYLPAFTGVTTSKEVFVAIHIEHDYRAGTKVYPHVHWSHIIGAPSGNIKWFVEYSVAKGHSVGTYPASTTVSIVQAAGAQYAHQIAEVSDADAIASTNLEPDSVVLIRLYRDPSDVADTFANDAFLIAIDLHYQSTGFYTNEKVSPFTQRYDIINT